MTRAPTRSDPGTRSAAIARAEKRLGIRPPDDMIEEAEKLTVQKIKVKKLPADYFGCLLEDEIVDACIRAAINGRCARCARFAT